MANQTELVGEIEINASAKCLRRSIKLFVGRSKIVYGYGREFSAAKSPIRVRYVGSVNDVGHYITPYQEIS